MSVQQQWHKVLYKKQNVPDNFVDESFLKDLQKNLHVQTYTVAEAIIGTCVVTQEISSMILFVIVYICMESQHLSATTLFAAGAIATLQLYILYVSVTPRTSDGVRTRTVLSDLTSVTFFLFFGFGLSPILKTLTQTISTDTVHAMAISMMMVRLIFHDYIPTAPIVSSSVPLSAALFSAICLASRLPSVECVFSLLTFSVQVFALFPIFRRRIEEFPKANLALTLLLVAAALGGLAMISISNCCVLMVVLIFVNVVCPVWFVKLQPYKQNLYGPWDEAVLQPAS